MFRKIGILAAAGVVGLALVSWAGLGSYCSTAWHNITAKLKKQVPLEFEIQRVRQQVADLVPDMRNQCHSVASEMMAVKHLREEVNDGYVRLDVQKKDIFAMKKALEEGNVTVTYKGDDYSADRIREKLDRDFRNYTVAEAELKTKERMLAAREKSLDNAKARLGEIKQQKAELELQVAQLEAQLKELRLAQDRSKFHFDDTSLAKCKASIAELRDRIGTDLQALELEGQLSSDTPPVTEHVKTTKELSYEIDAHFNGHAPKGNGTVVAK